jgi:hypothetical protein
MIGRLRKQFIWFWKKSEDANDSLSKAKASTYLRDYYVSQSMIVLLCL